VDISAHVAKALCDEHVRAADVVLTMTSAQRTLILDRFPSARGKVFRLGEHEQLDIVDPYQRHRVIFELAFAQIERSVLTWREDIARLMH
jgi:protein-tyrosine phosphatase